MIFLGASIFVSDENAADCCPKGCGTGDWLSSYVRHFNALEIDCDRWTRMQVPSLGELVEITPPGFRFAVIIQHKIVREIYFGSLLSPSFFLQSIRSFQESGKLGCLIAQFPQSLCGDRERLILLERLREGFAGLPLVIEFPPEEWLPKAAFQFLRDRGMGLVFMDESQPLIPTEKKVAPASNLGYMRFQGRSHPCPSKTGWGKSHDGYLYSVEDFKEWLPRIKFWRDQTEDLYLFVRGLCPEKASLDAWKLKILLEDALEDLGARRTMPAWQWPAEATR